MCIFVSMSPGKRFNITTNCGSRECLPEDTIGRPLRRGGSDEPPRTAREFRFFVEDRKSLGITAREIARPYQCAQTRSSYLVYRDDMPKPELFSAAVEKRYIAMPADERPSSPDKGV